LPYWINGSRSVYEVLGQAFGSDNVDAFLGTPFVRYAESVVYQQQNHDESISVQSLLAIYQSVRPKRILETPLDKSLSRNWLSVAEDLTAFETMSGNLKK
ncbi:hypothetical protein HK104_006189, partial [Borealophlyctis nickersoniae]